MLSLTVQSVQQRGYCTTAHPSGRLSGNGTVCAWMQSDIGVNMAAISAHGQYDQRELYRSISRSEGVLPFNQRRKRKTQADRRGYMRDRKHDFNGGYRAKTKRSANIILTLPLGLIATPLVGAYAISKHAAEAFNTVLRRELRHFGIRVSAIEVRCSTYKFSGFHSEALCFPAILRSYAYLAVR